MISNITHSLKVKTAQLGAMYRDGAQRNIAKLFTVNLIKQNKLITVSVVDLGEGPEGGLLTSYFA